MRQPRADREEKREAHANETPAGWTSGQEPLDLNDPNQRGSERVEL